MRTSVSRTSAAAFSGPHRVLIVEDHAFFASCLRAVLDNEPDFVVSGMVADSAEVIPRVAELNPGLLVVDLYLGARSGLDLGKTLRARQILTPILFISSLGQPGRDELAEIGRVRFVAKSAKPAEFLAAARELLWGSASPVTATAASTGYDRAAVRP